MREILFMAWDKNNEYGMCRVMCMDWVNSEACLCIDEDRASQVNLKFDRLEILQYIGQKDKSDKKIFAGHIIKGHYFIEVLASNLGVEEGEEEKIFLCQWNDYLAEYVFRTQPNNENDVVQKTYHDFSDEGIEIIGDIYTTPELIKESIKEII